MSCYRWEFSINPEPFYSFNISLAYAYNFILCVDILCILFSKNDIPWRNQHFYSQKFSWKVQWWKKIYSCSIWADLKCGSQDFLSIISVCHHNEKYQTKAESLGVARSHSLQSIYVRKCEGNFCKTNLNLKFCEKKLRLHEIEHIHLFGKGILIVLWLAKIHSLSRPINLYFRFCMHIGHWINWLIDILH